MPRLVWFTLLAAAAIGSLSHLPASALPDAQVVGISAEGEDFREGDRVPLRVEVRNGGDQSLPPVPVALTVAGEPFAEWKLPRELAPGESVTWDLTWTAKRGGYVLVATADPFNDVMEADETNNSTFINLGAAESRREFPWAAAVSGAVAFAVGLAAGFALRRGRPVEGPPAEPTASGAAQQ